MNVQQAQDRIDQELNFCLLGGWFAFFQAGMVIFAIVAYFIWPPVVSEHNIQKIYEGIQQSPFVYFMKLDPFVLIAMLFQMPVWLGLWSVLRKTDPALAALALTTGLLSIIAALPTGPIIELFSLSSAYINAGSTELKNIYIAAGEALFAAYNGTAWAVSIISGGLASILFALVMFKNGVFRKLTFWMMLISGIGALPVLVPVIGIILLFVVATILGVVASVLCGIDLLRYYYRGA